MFVFKAGVVGAGTMGVKIAQTIADADARGAQVPDAGARGADTRGAETPDTGARGAEAPGMGPRGMGASRGAGASGAERLAALIREARSVVALTGAGISVPSGIPDFRSPGSGLWEKVDPMEIAHIAVFRRDPQRFWSFYAHRFQTLEDKVPNGAHEVLAALERAGMLRAVITQNIDRLHERAGSQEVIEVHGTIAHSSCLRCRARYPLAEVRSRHGAAGDGVPRCDCGEPLKPDVVLFGEHLPVEAITRAEELATGADLMVCIGSSLEVYPVADLPLRTLMGGGAVAIVTKGPTPLDSRAAVKLDGDVVEELEAVARALGLGRAACPTRSRPPARGVPPRSATV